MSNSLNDLWKLYTDMDSAQSVSDAMSEFYGREEGQSINDAARIFFSAADDESLIDAAVRFFDPDPGESLTDAIRRYFLSIFPSTIENLSAAPDSGLVALDWDDSGEVDFDHYEYRYKAVGGPWSAWADVSDSEVTVTGLVNDTTYRFEVRVVDADGNESSVSTISSTPIADIIAPATPTGLASTPGSGQVVLNWDDNTEPDLAGYQWRKRTTAGPGAWSAWADVAVSTKTVTGLSDGVSYDFEVRAVDEVPNASAAASVTDTPADETAPDPASALILTPGSTQMTISWTASPSGDVDHYEVRYKEGAGSFGAWTTMASGSTITGLTNYVSHTFEVRAVDGASNASTSISGSSTPGGAFELAVLGTSTAPTLYLPMQETSGTFSDITGNGHTGSAKNSGHLTYNQTGMNSRKAVQNDGASGSGITMSQPFSVPANNTGKISVMCIFKSNGVNGHLVSMDGSGSDRCWCFQIQDKLYGFLDNASGPVAYVNTDFRNNAYHHAIWTCDSVTNVAKFYVDGTLRTTTGSIGDFLASDGSTPLEIFTSERNDFRLAGYISDVAVWWDYIVTASEAAAIYAAL